MKKKLKNKIGFTLTEVLVTVSIIASLSAIGIPQYNKYKTKAKRSGAYSAVNEILKAQKMAYSSLGSFDIYHTAAGVDWAGGSTSTNSVKIGTQVVFDSCAGCNEHYNIMMAVGNTTFIHQRRANNDVNGLWPTAAWTPLASVPANYERFVVMAKGDIFDDGAGAGTRQGDVLFYDSTEDMIKIVCDDANGTPAIANCRW